MREQRESVRGGANRPLDADLVLRPLRPDMFGREGRSADLLGRFVDPGPPRR